MADTGSPKYLLSQVAHAERCVGFNENNEKKETSQLSASTSKQEKESCSRQAKSSTVQQSIQMSFDLSLTHVIGCKFALFDGQPVFVCWG